jgi:hypothetical protein
MTLDSLEPPPSHPDLFLVERRPGSFNSSLCAQKVRQQICGNDCCLSKSAQSFTTGEIICKLEGLTKGPKAYSSVQCGTGEEDHFELCSDLLYSEL